MLVELPWALIKQSWAVATISSACERNLPLKPVSSPLVSYLFFRTLIRNTGTLIFRVFPFSAASGRAPCPLLCQGARCSHFFGFILPNAESERDRQPFAGISTITALSPEHILHVTTRQRKKINKSYLGKNLNRSKDEGLDESRTWHLPVKFHSEKRHRACRQSCLFP